MNSSNERYHRSDSWVTVRKQESQASGVAVRTNIEKAKQEAHCDPVHNIVPIRPKIYMKSTVRVIQAHTRKGMLWVWSRFNAADLGKRAKCDTL